MKKLLLIALLGLSLTAQAASHSANFSPDYSPSEVAHVCAAFYDMAYGVAKGRDDGVPITQYYAKVDQTYPNDPQSAAFIKDIISTIYQNPAMTPSQAGAYNLQTCSRQTARTVNKK